jgi:D-glycero-D-manno-heptose 1,7-bisphosphate phosphatase
MVDMTHSSGVPALLLDRDGTIIVDRNYLRRPEDVSLLPGAAAAIARANREGWRVVVVTNQSGIARGLLTETDYEAVAAELERQLAAECARLDLQLHCPHLRSISGPCECRKPGTKLYRDAIEQLGIDVSRSWFIGDRLRDISPSRALGGHGLHVLTGAREEHGAIVDAGFAQVSDLAAAVDHALSMDVRRDA